MNKYKIKYKNKKGKNISVNVNAEKSQKAIRQYANKMVFGYPIFINVSTKNVDAKTNGEEWGVFKCDGTTVNVDKK